MIIAEDSCNRTVGVFFTSRNAIILQWLYKETIQDWIFMPDGSDSKWILAPSLKYLNVRGLHVFTHHLYTSICEIPVSVPKIVNKISSAQWMECQKFRVDSSVAFFCSPQNRHQVCFALHQPKTTIDFTDPTD